MSVQERSDTLSPTAPFPRPALTVRRLLLMPVAFAAVLGPMSAARVPSRGFGYGAVAGLALAGAVLVARDGREITVVLLGYGLGIGLGWLLDDPCTPVGLFFGPVFGWFVVSMGLSRIRP